MGGIDKNYIIILSYHPLFTWNLSPPSSQSLKMCPKPIGNSGFSGINLSFISEKHKPHFSTSKNNIMSSPLSAKIFKEDSETHRKDSQNSKPCCPLTPTNKARAFHCKFEHIQQRQTQTIPAFQQRKRQNNPSHRRSPTSNRRSTQ